MQIPTTLDLNSTPARMNGPNIRYDVRVIRKKQNRFSCADEFYVCWQEWILQMRVRNLGRPHERAQVICVSYKCES